MRRGERRGRGDRCPDLDALHLAAVQRVGGPAVPLLTFDVRQAQAARSLGLTVVGI